ncbi:60S ribosomal protein L18a-like protein isoform X2 [Hibiscus syriacus]|uniref:60S ribosomal protein L18a-like protein isoform X1 n=1 Tax=Hibiscus syriacus TaxID=106335 RepID=UPI0019249477|nr:60S ribosomal protein L18a-like protein isoform X1 [Hibiscus syriacus]XP_039032384.1 60S ribosomal protein L18a-like protein isoform X1 [Hibiscus syriacus]XP_039032385.1 60S ribosomal protein L18a-like protein isoform X1 [Hibiscus syriacus]XP_039032386.1 60S ribosomal protein L18a-like protein isoform X2 [Hibiscus syriacus]
MDQRHSTEPVEHKNGEYELIGDAEDPRLGMYDKPLPCFGCGIGWFSLLLGFVFPLMWYYATILYFRNYYQRDPRERAGLAASAIAAMICTIAVIITTAVLIF